jgi:hypothetical protein
LQIRQFERGKGAVERGKEKKGEEEVVPKSCERGERKEVEASG